MNKGEGRRRISIASGLQLMPAMGDSPALEGFHLKLKCDDASCGRHAWYGLAGEAGTISIMPLSRIDVAALALRESPW